LRLVQGKFDDLVRSGGVFLCLLRAASGRLFCCSPAIRC
jgi:hypothetical protein